MERFVRNAARCRADELRLAVVKERPMYLRTYRETDFEAVYALDCVCFEPRFRFSRAMMRRVVGVRGAVVVLVCETELDGAEMIRGFCAVEFELVDAEKVGYVATLDVDPRCRRRGVGRWLMSEVERLAAQADAHVMLLHVYAGNAAAVRLYEALEYLHVGDEAGFYGKGFDARLYTKRLLGRS